MDVRTQVSDFNWEIDLFLRSLTRFRQNVNKADSNTIQLLSDTLESIGEFINGHDGIVEKGEKSNMFIVDDNKFEIGRFITCRICCLQIPLTRTEYLNHVTSDYHNSKLIRQEKSCDQKTVLIDRVPNGIPNESNGKHNNHAANRSNAAKTNASWRDRELTQPRPPSAPISTSSNGAMSCVTTDLAAKSASLMGKPTSVEYPQNPPMNHQASMMNYNFGCQKAGPPLYMNHFGPRGPYGSYGHYNPYTNQISEMPMQPPARLQPIPMPTALSPLPSYQQQASAAVPVFRPNTSHSIQTVLQDFVKSPAKPKAKTSAPLPTNQQVSSAVAQTPNTTQTNQQISSATVPVSDSNTPKSNQNALQKSDKPQLKSITTAAAPVSSSLSSTVKPVSSTVTQKTSPIVPNVFDENIFEFIESQGKVKRTESLQSVKKPDEPKNKKIVNATTSAEIKPCKPYDLNSMYSKFSHLKTSAASASVPIATKPVAAKPTPSALASSQSKSSDVDDLQIHKFLSKVAQKPNHTHSVKSLNEVKSQNTNAQKKNVSNGNDQARPALSAGLSGKLKQMFDEINKLQSKAELEQELQTTRSLQRTSSIVSLPAAGNESINQLNDSNPFRRSQNASVNSQSNFRGRSLSNSNLADKSKGAIPKQRNPPSTNNDNNSNNNRYCTEKARAVLTAFFSRDLIPFLSQLMDTASGLSILSLNESITKQIEQLMSPKFPTAKCYLIGSRVYGIGKGSSPIDIYLNLHDSFNQDKSAKIFSDGIAAAENLFKKSSDWSDVKCSEPTRYGILSATHNATKMKCRMVFGTGVPVHNTKVIQCLFDVQPVCRQLVICIQLAMQDMQIPSLQRFKNGYVATLLVLFFFQKQGKLPTVKTMQEKCANRIKCGENAVEFQKPTNVVICSDRFLDILVSFFKFYSDFNFSENIISVFQGHEINHSVRATHDNKLEASLLRFKRFYLIEPWKWPSHGMCIQDIFMHKRNVTSVVNGAEIAAFRNFCKDALDALQSVAPSVRY